jgi:hypothetical protein
LLTLGIHKAQADAPSCPLTHVFDQYLPDGFPRSSWANHHDIQPRTNPLPFGTPMLCGQELLVEADALALGHVLDTVLSQVTLPRPMEYSQVHDYIAQGQATDLNQGPKDEG